MTAAEGASMGKRDGGRARAWLELARVSNLPTCVTNVLAGSAIGAAAVRADLPWPKVAAACAGVALLYVSGMMLNDAFDAPRDAAERPRRPIPSGRVGRRSAFAAGAAAMALGAATIVAAEPAAAPWALLLAAAILLYDALHALHPATAILMGACRGLVYVASASVAAGRAAPAPGTTWLFAAALAAYVVGVTLVARGEHRAGAAAPPLAPIILAATALAPGIVVRPADPLWPAVFGGAAVAVIVLGPAHFWTRPPRVPRLVAGLLAAICLVDAYVLALSGQPALAGAAAGGFLVARAAQRLIAGT
jgi:4-hydroxybenzoate polyprenyltransferase